MEILLASRGVHLSSCADSRMERRLLPSTTHSLSSRNPGSQPQPVRRGSRRTTKRPDETAIHIRGGGPAILEIGSLRLLTDPAFDPPAGRYRAAPLPGFGCRKLTGSAIPSSAIGSLDAILLSHHHHFDNLGEAGRALLPSAPVVLTTPVGARRLKGNAKEGPMPWETVTVGGKGGAELVVTATPARHGPPGARLTAGAVTGFSLAWEGQRHGELYLSGDTRLFRGVRQVGQRHRISVRVLNLGPARFTASGPIRYTFDAAEAAQVLRARTVIPNHYEGFSHYKQSAAVARRVLADAGTATLWVPRGSAVEVEI
jgi:L-ascorbate metabolism protein UlaG (beta-lactamase superfamily)